MSNFLVPSNGPIGVGFGTAGLGANVYQVCIFTFSVQSIFSRVHNSPWSLVA